MTAQHRQKGDVPLPQGVTAKLGPKARSGGGNGDFIYGTLIQCLPASGSFNWIFFLLVLGP